MLSYCQRSKPVAKRMKDAPEAAAAAAAASEAAAAAAAAVPAAPAKERGLALALPHRGGEPTKNSGGAGLDFKGLLKKPRW